MFWLLLTDLYVFIVSIYYTSCTGSLARDWPRRYNPKSGSEEKILGGLFTRKPVPEPIIVTDHFSIYSTAFFTPPPMSTIYTTIRQNITGLQGANPDTTAVISIMAIAVVIFLVGLGFGLKFLWANRQATLSTEPPVQDEKQED